MWFTKRRRAQNDQDYETWIVGGVSPTLNAFDNAHETRATILVIDGTRVDDVRIYDDGLTPCLKNRMGTGGNNVPFIATDVEGKEVAATLRGFGHGWQGQHNSTHAVVTEEREPVIAFDGYNQSVTEDVYRALRIGIDSGDCIMEPTMQVRRLTPLECTRLMGWRDDHLEIGTLDAKDQDYARQVVRHLWRNLQPQTVQRDIRGFWGVLTPEVLLSAVCMGWISWNMAGECAASAREIQGENAWPEAFMRRLWAYQESRPSPYRREPFEQLAGELGRSLSFMPFDETSDTKGLFYLRVYESAQGTGLLQQALDSLAEMGRPFIYQEQVANISDTNRYKMCGNGVASPVAQWIGEAIMRCRPDAEPRSFMDHYLDQLEAERRSDAE